MEHTVKIKPGDSVHILVADGDSYRGKRINATDILAERKPRKHSEPGRVSRTLVQYCNAIKTSKWHTGAPVSVVAMEHALARCIDAQLEITLIGLSDSCAEHLKSVLPLLSNPATFNSVQYALNRIVIF